MSEQQSGAELLRGWAATSADHRNETGRERSALADAEYTYEYETVAEAGEREVLRLVLAEFRAAPAASVGPGDDCAVLAPGACDVVTTDTMFEGSDFRLDWHDPWRLGWKIAAVNLSDVAAMGATPTALTVAVGVPGNKRVSRLVEIARGIQGALDELAPGCGVVGGDLATAPVLSLSVTAFGSLGAPAVGPADVAAPVLRSGARPGDVLCYAGQGLGLSRLGLQLLLRESEGGQLHYAKLSELQSLRPLALDAHLVPRPPIALGSAARLAGATAMIDVSDGLALDAWRIARASGVRIELSKYDLLTGFAVSYYPFDADAAEEVPLDLMLYGGEDHGLLATFPADSKIPEGFVPIGSVHADGAPSVRMRGELVPERGWDALSAE